MKTLMTALIFLVAQASFAKEIRLSPGSSAIIYKEIVAVSCADDGKAKFFCRGQGDAAYLYQKGTFADGTPASQYVDKFSTLDECLERVQNSK